MYRRGHSEYHILGLRIRTRCGGRRRRQSFRIDRPLLLVGITLIFPMGSFLGAGHGRALMQWFKGDIVFAEQLLVLLQLVEQLTLSESASPLSWDFSGGHTLNPSLHAVGTWEFAIAFHLAMLAQDASEHSLRF